MAFWQRWARGARQPNNVQRAEASPLAFVYEGGQVRPVALKYRDGEFNSSFGAWTVPGYGSQGFSANEEGYARAYTSVVWAFRAVNVLVQKVSDVLRQGQIVDKASGKEISAHPYLTALELAYQVYQQDVYETWMQGKSLYGEAYIELITTSPLPGYGIPRGVRVLNPLAIEPIISYGKVAQYRYNGDDKSVTFTPAEIAFDRYANPLDDYRGLSPLASALSAANIDRQVVILTQSHLGNNARPGLIFTPKEGRLSQADVDLIQTTLREDVKGSRNAGKPLLMPTAFDVTVADPPQMSDLSVTTDEQKRRICSAVGVPVALVDYTDMAYQLSPEQNRTFYELSLIPNAERVARVINAQILPFFDPSRSVEFRLPVDAIRAQLADPRVRTEIANLRFQAGTITLNEYRESLDLKPVPDGDVRVIPMGLQVVKAGELGLVPLAPPPSAPTPFGGGFQAIPAAQPQALRALTDEARDALTNWRQKAIKRGRGIEFATDALDAVTVLYIKSALLTSQSIDAIFQRARQIELDAQAVKKKSDDQFATPEEYLAYWGDYDAIMAEIGDDWLTLYMREILADLLTSDSAPTVDTIEAALEKRREQLAEQWTGTEDDPGALARIMLAGMGAGQAALENNQSIDPEAAKAVTLAVDWSLLSKEALAFVRNYAFDLIRGVNQTTVDQVQKALTAWMQSGEPLAALKDELVKVFNNPVRAALIAQTETTRAYNEGANQRWRDAGVTKAKWQTVVDNHVCPICAPLHNTVADLNTGWKSSKGNVHPPAHPGCRCFSRPVLDTEAVKSPFDDTLDQMLKRNEAAFSKVRGALKDPDSAALRKKRQVRGELFDRKYDLNLEIDELTDYVQNASWDDPEFDAKNARWMKLIEERERVKLDADQLLDAIAKDQDKARRAALRNPGDPHLDYTLPGGSASPFSRPKDIRGLREGTTWLNDVLDGREYNDIRRFRVYENTTGRAFHRAGDIYIAPGEDTSTVVHEIGHAIEEQYPDVHRRAIEFLERRRTSASTQRLQDLVPGSTYKDNEVAYPGNFHDPYVGKVYLADDGSYRASEVISMGLERLYRDAQEFAVNDPEYFDFIMAVLRRTT